MGGFLFVCSWPIEYARSMGWRTIEDDRGQVKRVAGSYYSDPRPWEDGIWHNRRWEAAVVLPALAACLLLFGLTIPTLRNWQGWSNPKWLLTLLAWAGFAASIYFFGGMITRMHRAKDRRLLICPACGMDLKSTKVDDDGCSVCPRCHGAWRLGDRFSSPRIRKKWLRFSPIYDDRGVEQNALPSITPQGLLPPRDDPRLPMPSQGNWAYGAPWLGGLAALIVFAIGLPLTNNSKAAWPSYAVILGGIAVFGIGLTFYTVQISKYVRPVIAR